VLHVGTPLSDPGRPIAARLLRLCLQPNGTLLNSPMLASTIRAALLADLALRGALVSTAGGLELDMTPTGFPAADNLLAAVAAQPDKPMEWWLRRGTAAVRDVVNDLVRSGTWTGSRQRFARHYRDGDPAGVQIDARRVRAALDEIAADPGTAVLAALVAVIGTVDEPGGQHPTQDALAACGPARWLMEDLIGYLLARRALLATSAAEARIALGANFIV
jgi:hypothetical protein